jgi:hypothetical protein
MWLCLLPSCVTSKKRALLGKDQRENGLVTVDVRGGSAPRCLCLLYLYCLLPIPIGRYR